MPSGIEGWRRRENSGRFVGSRLREKRKSISGNPLSRGCRRRVLRIRKHCAVREDLAIELVRSHEMLVCPHLGAEAQVPVGS
jgi:hypothetical protein